MAFPLLPATLGLIAAGLAALNYFVPPEADTPAPDTEPIQPPYTPPFTGGQCVGIIYSLRFTVIYGFSDGRPNTTQVFNTSGRGAIRGTRIDPNTNNGLGSAYLLSTGQNGLPTEVEVATGGSVQGGAIRRPISASIEIVARADGQPDNCGDLPNPNPPFPISDTGLANSPDPDLDGLAEPLTLGLVPVNLAALLAAALAAMQAAETIAALATALADAIRALKDLIDELKPENRDKNKSKFKFDFGSIEKDGYLKFYGTNNNPNFEAIYLDILFTDEPIGIGKYFGRFSPNRYIYDRLGYIAFVSPSLGVMEVRELEFYRCSLSIPKDCVGFFYHLGLNGSIKANVSAIYELKLDPEPEEG